MPIYEYVCATCGERFELKQKFSDPPVTSCAAFACEKNQPVQKVISAPAIMFKGSGWYVTDYSDKLKEPKKADASDAKSSETSQASKSEGGTSSMTPAASSATTGNGTGSSSGPSSSASSSSSTSSQAVTSTPS